MCNSPTSGCILFLDVSDRVNVTQMLEQNTVRQVIRCELSRDEEAFPSGHTGHIRSQGDKLGHYIQLHAHIVCRNNYSWSSVLIYLKVTIRYPRSADKAATTSETQRSFPILDRLVRARMSPCSVQETENFRTQIEASLCRRFLMLPSRLSEMSTLIRHVRGTRMSRFSIIQP